MYVNEAKCRRAVDRAKVKAADSASCAVLFDATGASDWVSLVRIYRHLSDSAFKELLSAEQFVWQYIARRGIAAGKQSSDNFISELPNETAIFCSLASCDDVPPLVFTRSKTIWMGAERLLHSATDATHGAIDLHDCSKAKNRSELTGTCRMVRCEEKRLQSSAVCRSKYWCDCLYSVDERR